MGGDGSWRDVSSSSPTLIPAIERRNADLNRDSAERAGSDLLQAELRTHARRSSPSTTSRSLMVGGEIAALSRNDPAFSGKSGQLIRAPSLKSSARDDTGSKGIRVWRL